MKRCLSEKELFSLANMKAAPSSNNRAAGHLTACAECARKVEETKALRSAAVQALQVEEPDWTGIDRVINAAIRERASAPKPSFSWFPFGFAAAAGALVVLAMLAPRWQTITSDDSGEPLMAQNPPVLSQSEDAPQMLAAITDTVGQVSNGSVGESIFAGFETQTDDTGGIRVAMDTSVSMEVSPASKFTVHSTGTDSPAVEISKGELDVEVPAGALERPMVIMAGASSFAIFTGFAQFSLFDGKIAIQVREGEVLPISTETRLEPLTVGTWISDDVEIRGGQDDWIPLVQTRYAAKEAQVTEVEAAVPDRKLVRPKGTLSKRLIRETMVRAKPRLTACYESSLKRFPSLNASIPVTAKLAVSPSGSVNRVKLKGAEEWPELDRCLQKVFKGMVFPPPKGGALDLILPLRLSPRH